MHTTLAPQPGQDCKAPTPAQCLRWQLDMPSSSSRQHPHGTQPAAGRTRDTAAHGAAAELWDSAGDAVGSMRVSSLHIPTTEEQPHSRVSRRPKHRSPTTDHTCLLPVCAQTPNSLKPVSSPGLQHVATPLASARPTPAPAATQHIHTAKLRLHPTCDQPQLRAGTQRIQTM
jgi:hypothetical protein